MQCFQLRMHIAWTGCRSFANPTYLWIRNCSEEQIFCIRASSNVWVSHLSSRCIKSDIACTWHDQVVKVFQIERFSGSEIVQKDKFFASRQVRMSGCRERPQDASHLTAHARGMNRLTCLVQFKSPLNLQPKSKQIFCIMSSSNVWVSRPTSRCIPSDIGCTWHGQPIVVLQIERISGSEIVWEDKFFASRQVRMSGCRKRPQDASHLTSDAHDMNRVS